MKKSVVLATFFLFIGSFFLSSSFAKSISDYDLVFLRNLGGNWNIWVYKLDSKELKQVTFDANDDGCPVWTKDKQGIAFIRHGDIYHSVNGKEELLVTGGCYRYLSYDRYNDRLLFSWFVEQEECDIGYYDFKTKKEGIILTRPRQQVHPKASYDGRFIYFDECYLSREFIVIGELCRFDTKTSRVSVLQKADQKAFYRPSPNPNDESTVYVSNQSGRTEIYLVSPNCEAVKLSRDDSIYNDFPSWRPDGKILYYTSLIDNRLKLLAYNLENKSRQVLDISGECRESDL